MIPCCVVVLLLPLPPGGAANPYVSVEVGDEKRRTAVETGTVSPVWDEEIMVFSETSLRNVSTGPQVPRRHTPTPPPPPVAQETIKNVDKVTEPKDRDAGVHGAEITLSETYVSQAIKPSTLSRYSGGSLLIFVSAASHPVPSEEVPSPYG